jgi:hypothetical protein
LPHEVGKNALRDTGGAVDLAAEVMVARLLVCSSAIAGHFQRADRDNERGLGAYESPISRQ